MFQPNPLYFSDGYKPSHKKMLATGTTSLYGTWIPRTLKYAPQGIKKIVSFGQQLSWHWIKDVFDSHFFYTKERRSNKLHLMSGRTSVAELYDEDKLKAEAMQFIQDMELYLGIPYDGEHFGQLWDLGYLPLRVKALPEGIETNPNIPHQTFRNTIDGYAWLTLYMETIVSATSWKPSTSATLAKQFLRVTTEWVNKTDEDQQYLIPYMCHDFSARGLDPFSMMSSGLGHATAFRGSDTLITIPASRYYYGVKKNETPINSVIASEHSVSTTKIFTVGEKQMLIDWLIDHPIGILSVVADTFDLWVLLVEYLTDPEVKKLVMARDGKLVIRPDSGDPVEIICGRRVAKSYDWLVKNVAGVDYKDWLYKEGDKYFVHHATEGNADVTDIFREPEIKGVVQILWDNYGGTTNKQGYKVLDSHIGCIYGDSINLERQTRIYQRLAENGFAATNVVLGIGSYTYQYNTRDTFGFAAKGSWFRILKNEVYTTYDIYKDPVTDDGSKRSLRGLLRVDYDDTGEIVVYQQQTEEQEQQGLLQVIFEDGELFNTQTLDEIRERTLASL